jgi:hypothetical protein
MTKKGSLGIHIFRWIIGTISLWSNVLALEDVAISDTLIDEKFEVGRTSDFAL